MCLAEWGEKRATSVSTGSSNLVDWLHCSWSCSLVPHEPDRLQPHAGLLRAGHKPLMDRWDWLNPLPGELLCKKSRELEWFVF